jgi:hypothetical protein
MVESSKRIFISWDYPFNHTDWSFARRICRVMFNNHTVSIFKLQKRNANLILSSNCMKFALLLLSHEQAMSKFTWSKDRRKPWSEAENYKTSRLNRKEMYSTSSKCTSRQYCSKGMWSVLADETGEFCQLVPKSTGRELNSDSSCLPNSPEISKVKSILLYFEVEHWTTNWDTHFQRIRSEHCLIGKSFLKVNI